MDGFAGDENEAAPAGQARLNCTHEQRYFALAANRRNLRRRHETRNIRWQRPASRPNLCVTALEPILAGNFFGVKTVGRLATTSSCSRRSAVWATVGKLTPFRRLQIDPLRDHFGGVERGRLGRDPTAPSLRGDGGQGNRQEDRGVAEHGPRGAAGGRPAAV